MRVRSRNACLAAAVLTALYGGTTVNALDLTWDGNGPSAPVGADGSGAWDTTSLNWYDPISATNVVFTNGSSAIFGTGTVGFNNVSPGYNVDLSEAITVQDITLGTAIDGGGFSISDFNGGTLTLAGNVTRSINGGTQQLFLNNGLTLTSGAHVFAINDSPGDAAELTVNGVVKGAGGITLDNATQGYQSWGTLVLNFANEYDGATSVSNGRLIINDSHGLGSTVGGTTISNMGALSIGGAGTNPGGGVTIDEPITITRDTYSGGDFGNYNAAIISANTGNISEVNTFNGPVVIDSTDARFQANTSKIVINSNMTQGPNVAAGVFTADGDFAGTISLTGNNTALLGGIKLMGGVELDVTNDNNLAGASAPLTMVGGTLHPIGGFMTDFGTHVLNTASFSGGIDVDSGKTFTINQSLTGGSLGKRGAGVLNIGGANSLTGGQTFFDSGTVNMTGTGTSTYHSLHLRTATLNIGAGTIITTNNYTSIGQDSAGTAGGPDKGTVNISGSAALILGNADFNVSDNANTAGTINISDNAILHTLGGLTFVGKATGAVGTINQSGGTFTIDRTGNFAFVLGDGRGSQSPKGNYNLGGGTFESKGEVYVGEGNNSGQSGQGVWSQSGGVVNLSNWFVVGREGGVGTVDLSGNAVFNKTGGGNISMSDTSNPGGLANTMTVRGNAAINQTGGEFWVGQNGNSIGILTLQDSGQINVSSWVAIGRAGGNGTVTISGGTFTQSTSNWLTIGSNGNGYVNITNGALSALQTYVGEVGVGKSGILKIDGGKVSLGTVIFANANNTNGTINLNGGSLTAIQFTAQNGGGTGSGNLMLNGGTLYAAADNTNFAGLKVTSRVGAGGAKVNVNGHAVTYNSVLTHDASVVGADGGLTVTGAGTLSVTGASTYTGPTVVNLAAGNASALRVNYSASAASASTPILTGAAGADIQSGEIVFDYTGSTTPASIIAGLLTTSHSANFATGQIRSSTATASRGLGYLDNGTSAVAVKYTYYGDTNLDGKVDIVDLGKLAGKWQQAGVWGDGDLNYDGTVNIVDLGLLAGNWQQGVGSPLGEPSFTEALASLGLPNVSVPEPTSITLLGLGAAGLIARRRRRSA